MTATTTPLRESLRLRAASERTGIPVGTLRQHISDGTLRAYLVGARVYVYADDLAALFKPYPSQGD
jgi:excisionase family DNA binding protein